MLFFFLSLQATFVSYNRCYESDGAKMVSPCSASIAGEHAHNTIQNGCMFGAIVDALFLLQMRPSLPPRCTRTVLPRERIQLLKSMCMKLNRHPPHSAHPSLPPPNLTLALIRAPGILLRRGVLLSLATAVGDSGRVETGGC